MVLTSLISSLEDACFPKRNLQINDGDIITTYLSINNDDNDKDIKWL